ncbi:aspartate/glutamate racemase family protein [Rhodobacteraceae bacterium SC52]|nr:aspartate/glutamate racemase family protein [Rhodobacteraceae bacterium SC52]
MLDTAFERVVGDAGHADSYEVPAKIKIVPNAGSPDIVRNGRPDPALVTAFCDAARELEAEGAIALTSTCGFLLTVQDDIARAVRVPVIVSALSLFALVHAMHGGQPVGILTASTKALGQTVLDAAGVVPGQAVIAGMEDVPAFASAILVPKSQQPKTIDCTTIEAAVVRKAVHLCRTAPAMRAILLECGNLPPYADAIKAATGLPVYSILDGARFAVSGAMVT